MRDVPIWARWGATGLLALGVLLTTGATRQKNVPLARPLPTTVPHELLGYPSWDVEISEAEQEAAGMSQYLMRAYGDPDVGEYGDTRFSIYVGYYESQTQGRTIHSPKNCLPGAGWEALTSRIDHVDVAGREVPVNRYLLRRGETEAMVVYWYQGRGRVQADEYVVKFDLLRDAALRGRTEEALVRVVVPVRDSREAAYQVAEDVARRLIPAVARALPGPA